MDSSIETIQKYEIGDCLSLLPSIPDKSVNLILTDLPYGQTACAWDSIIPLEPLWQQYKRILTDNGAIVLTCTFKFGIALVNANPDMFRYDLVWEKTRATGFLLANKMPMRKHELILVFYNKLPTFNPQYTKGAAYTKDSARKDCLYGKQPELRTAIVDKDTCNPVSVIKFDRKARPGAYGDINRETGKASWDEDGPRRETSILKHANANNHTNHPTQKPLSLFEYLIKTYTNEGDMVHDSCLGAGTTLEACVNLNRDCIGFEFSKEWEYNYKKILDSKKNMYQLSKIFKRKIS